MAIGARGGSFPPGFLWGVAGSGYQIEGAWDADGKGPSIWDAFVRREGAVLHGDTGDRACDALAPTHQAGDLALLARLGVGASIFSVQWPRVQPTGRGRAVPRGLDRYRRHVDGLLAAGVRPALTLHHWELPQALQERGGWADRDTVHRFVEYASIVHAALGDRVPIWIPQNEPETFARVGHVDGKHAPGLREPRLGLVVAHHLLLANGLATASMRERAAASSWQNAFGPVINLSPFRPANPRSAADRAAAARLDGERNRFFLDALFHGRYPADVLRRKRAAGRDGGLDAVRDGDLAAIATRPDFLGINYYRSERVAPEGCARTPTLQKPEGETTAAGWPVDPAGLRETLVRVRDGWTGELPLVVTENGTSCRDTVDPEGRCKDPERIDFLRRHLREARRAIVADGVPLRGYVVWSLLDNFEWESGYRERFGLVHVDYPTGRRTPKDSFDWYRARIAANAVD